MHHVSYCSCNKSRTRDLALTLPAQHATVMPCSSLLEIQPCLVYVLLCFHCYSPEKKRFRFDDNSDKELLRLLIGQAGQKIYRPSHEGWERVAEIMEEKRGGGRKIKPRTCYERTKLLVEQHTKKMKACAKT